MKTGLVAELPIDQVHPEMGSMPHIQHAPCGVSGNQGPGHADLHLWRPGGSLGT